MNLYRYTDNELKKLLKTMVILCDTSLSLQSEHGFNLAFIDRNDAGLYIYSFLYYHVRNKFLKG